MFKFSLNALLLMSFPSWFNFFFSSFELHRLQDSLVADFFCNTHLDISIFVSSSDSPLRILKHPGPFWSLQWILQVLRVCDAKKSDTGKPTLHKTFSPITGFSAIFQTYIKCSWNLYLAITIKVFMDEMRSLGLASK